jgi:lysyl-tRNA synthetase, class II
VSELDQQIENRRLKRRELGDSGIDPYPGEVVYDLEPAAVHARFGELDAEALDALSAAEKSCRVPGRVRSLRKHGKTVFLDLHDGTTKLQAMLRTAQLDETSAAVLEQLDLGDYALVEGEILRTRTGELTVAGQRIVLLSKALRPLPEKFHGMTDVEARYRRRYLDLAANESTRRIFEVRAAMVREIRRFLEAHGFLEVETPMMQALPGGAAARPFVTHHNALDLELYLRIAPELFLKRLLVGGMHRVYEINRNFRNEGISTQHNPEFTMLEFYWAYSDYRKLMDFTEELLGTVAERVLGERAITWKGERIPLDSPWPRYTMREAVVEVGGVSPEVVESVAGMAAEFDAHPEWGYPAAIHDTGHPALHGTGEPAPKGYYGHFLVDLFEHTVERKLTRPTFITEYPVEISPLARLTPDSSQRSPDEPRFTERFELFIGGMEVANAFSELNDPDEQARRFEQQLEKRGRGDDEAHLFDRDYVEALEHGMPPAGGEGIGIDRLAMLFTDSSSIREVILFPLLRPREEEE